MSRPWTASSDAQERVVRRLLADAGIPEKALTLISNRRYFRGFDAVATHAQWLVRQREYFRATFDGEPDSIGHSAAAGARAIAAFLES